MRKHATKLGPAVVIGHANGQTLALRKVLQPKLRSFETDPNGHLIDRLLWKHGELGEKTAPLSEREIRSIIYIYGPKTDDGRFWTRLLKELHRSLKNPKPLEYEE